MPALPYIAQGDPSRPAISDPTGTWTYGELSQRVDSVAGRLGPLKGERVGLFLDRTRASLALLLGVFEAGGVAVPFSLRATPREHAWQIEDSGMSRIVVEPESERVLGESLILAHATPRLLPSASLFEGGAPSPPGSVPADAPAAMVYTSGTTGRPKGVVHTHASLVSQVDVLFKAWEWSADDRLLHVLPLHHVHGLVNGALGALWAGATLQFRKTFEPEEVWDSFAARSATVFYAVPTLYHRLAEAWTSADSPRRTEWSRGAAALRLSVSGSAALPKPLWMRWREITGQPLLERYGMTEIGMALSNPYRGERRPGTVGTALPGMDVRLVGEDGRDVAPGLAGEIWVRGKSLFKEYWNRPDSTRESFQEGYFRTGDIAELDAGYIRICGRASVDIIKSAGFKISALEIEGVMLEHPAIREAAVVGQPDAEWGEIITAFVVLQRDGALTLDGLKDFCRDRLAPYKLPRRLRFLEELPRNAMGKVTKPALIGQ